MLQDHCLGDRQLYALITERLTGCNMLEIVQENAPPHKKWEALEERRDRIGEIDQEIIRLIAERMEVSAEIGALKKQLHLNVRDQQVEQRVLAKATRLAERYHVDPELTKSLINLLIAYSLRRQGYAGHFDLGRW